MYFPYFSQQKTVSKIRTKQTLTLISRCSEYLEEAETPNWEFFAYIYPHLKGPSRLNIIRCLLLDNIKQ